MSAWYIAAGDTHFNWAKAPTFECPNAATDGRPIGAMLAEDAAITPLVARARLAADALGVDAAKVIGMLRRMHSGGTRRAEIDGKLTDRCAHCGAKMKRKGFRAWIDEPGSWDGYSGATRSLNQMIGNSEPPRKTIRTTWHKTKKEAEAWARHECRRAKAAA